MPSGWEALFGSVLQSVAGFAALWALYFRTGKALAVTDVANPQRLTAQNVSVIIPARNEAENLRQLLPSLRRDAGADFEVLVVDDHSTDATARVAAELGARVVWAGQRPAGWTGKSWACHVGAQSTTRDVLLFIDADTIQDPRSIEGLLPRLQVASLVSAAPYHLNPSWWEKLMGPFQILVLLGCAWDGGSRYAIGQFLMFRREVYEKLGGHEKVRETICEDLELAHLVREAQSRGELDHGVWSDLSGQVFKVRMYDSFAKFWSGWRRLMRLGLRRSTFWGGLAVYLAIANLSLGFNPGEAHAAIWALAFGGWLAVFGIQRRWGDFSLLGVLAFPATLLLFVVLTMVAIFDQILRRDFVWRGRSYSWQVR
jgi:4,4'-diaponeurosporenoate glycosyltransferase